MSEGRLQRTRENYPEGVPQFGEKLYFAPWIQERARVARMRRDAGLCDCQRCIDRQLMATKFVGIDVVPSNAC